MKRILVCDDDKEIVQAIYTLLVSEGYDVTKCSNGKEAENYLNKNEVDLIILDIMMPEQDGITTLFNIREKHNPTPVIILSAKSENEDKVTGLNIGADDYITKPFNLLELVARVKSLLRRNEMSGGGAIQNDEIIIGDLKIYNTSKEVYVQDEQVKLTPTEFDILYLLASNIGKVLSTNDIYEKIWHQDAIGVENTVAVHIRHIREKIEINPNEPKYIKVIWGLGYKIDKV